MIKNVTDKIYILKHDLQLFCNAVEIEVGVLYMSAENDAIPRSLVIVESISLQFPDANKTK